MTLDDDLVIVLLLHARRFVKRSPAIISSNWSASTVRGISSTLLLLRNSPFGRQSKPGATNEAW